jgi:hypothetical protein
MKYVFMRDRPLYDSRFHNHFRSNPVWRAATNYSPIWFIVARNSERTAIIDKVREAIGHNCVNLSV